MAQTRNHELLKLVSLDEVNIDGNTTADNRVKPEEELQIVFRNLTYKVNYTDTTTKKQATKTILSNVTGAFQPGRLTVILGSSGAGKTSLLNLLSGEVNHGTATGEILVNGQPTTGHGIRKLAGYVYQDDIIYNTMTVRESILLSARLRIPKTVSDEGKKDRVEDIISLLHLKKAANTIIGNERIKGISGGERKRTSIGMELVNNPAILFLDEPTSGLDTFTAYSVLLTLKKLAQSGRTIVATLHQPSSEIFHLIDDVMLMSEGRIVYFGDANHSVEYFANQGYECPRYSNPADFFFMSIFGKTKGLTYTPDSESNIDTDTETNISIGRGTNADTINTVVHGSNDRIQSRKSAELAEEDTQLRLKQLLDIWPTTPEGRALEEVTLNPRTGGFSRANAKYRSGFMDQIPMIFKRAVKNLLRDKLVFGMKTMQTLVFAVILDLIYWQISNRNQDSQVQDRTGVLFFYAVNLLMSNAMAILTVFSTERAVFERENRSGLYGLPAYFISKLGVELPLYIFFPLVLVTATYFAFGLRDGFGHFLITCLICVLMAGVGMGIGMFSACTFQDLSVALAVVPVFILPMMMFSGLFVNLGGMPAWIGWVKWLSPMKYGFVALVKNEFSDRSIGCGDSVPADQCHPRAGNAIIQSLGMENQGSVWLNIGVVFCFWVALTSLAYVGLWRIVWSARRGRDKVFPKVKST